jgi:membrane associated rhomboid family serine protease
VIPLVDDSRRPAQFPIITAVIILLNLIGFIVELVQGDALVIRWSVIPADIVAARHWETILTAMFMHASWSHIIGNMLFLWVFGPEIEDAMGRGRFVVFYLMGGVAATAAQIAADPTSTLPNLGASGAIAAVMGAFLVTYPRDRIRTILFLGWFVRITFIPAALLIGVWFLFQVLDLGTATDVESQSGGIAYLAHIGGMIFGALTARLVEDPRRIGGRV